MEKLKEYAWVVVAIVTVMTSLGSHPAVVGEPVPSPVVACPPGVQKA